MILTFDSIKEDIQSFADDPEDVVIDRPTGKVLFTRNGKDHQLDVLYDNGHIKNVKYLEQTLPYRTFLAKHLGNLDLFAERLLLKRKSVDAFVNGPATLDTIEQADRTEGNALDILKSECSAEHPFNSKVIFITADAGHGKTALLREFQLSQAKKYRRNQTDYLFWHVDLQGRQLLRLSEALMGDLGELRISGLWMQSIIRLVKHGLLVIGIDGFDELAAEQGSNDALGALALLINQLDSNGTIIAASRRTFFNTDDYIKRSKLISGKVNTYCTFNQINLDDWEREQAEEYLLARGIENFSETYTEVKSLLGQQGDHPILTRPFLLSQLANALINYSISVEDFIGGMKNPHDPKKGVNSIIEALVRREVSDKWKVKDTGEPYLTFEQHFEFLSLIAEEMWKGQVESLSLDFIQTLIVILLDDWGIVDEERRYQVVEMIKMHALLVIPNDNDSNSRSFEHPEFRDYFTARSLETLIKNGVKNESITPIRNFLSIAQISDSLALYTCSNTKLNNSDVPKILEIFKSLIDNEWRPTFLQTNIGTLVPFMINGYDLQEKLSFKAKVNYSSLVFENKMLENTTLEEGNFLNTSFSCTQFNNVDFVKSTFNDVVFDKDVDLESVTFVDCDIRGVIVKYSEQDLRPEYSPNAINSILKNLGATIIDAEVKIEFPENDPKEHHLDKIVFRFLRAMQRTTFISKNNIDTRLRSDKYEIYEIIIPSMVAHGILEERFEKGEVWALKASYESMSKAKDGDGDSQLHLFWSEIHSM